MGKVCPEYHNDATGLAQWIMRKLSNHHPLSERDKGSNVRKKLPRQHVYEDRNVVHYVLRNGRAFLISVEEVPLEQVMDTYESVGAD
jgi:hypothetical protein